MNKEKIKKLIPLGLVVGGMVYTTIRTATSDVALTQGHWFAYVLTAIILLTYFINKKISNVILGIALVLGLLNLIKFTPTTITFGGGLKLGDSDFIISLQLYALIALAFFFYNHRKPILDWFNKDGL
ncbi:MAG: hypothetical protein EBR30_29075 [Cytophagia bacterium]|nr:hypothetical protein [Cytophagia bacterium]